MKQKPFLFGFHRLSGIVIIISLFSFIPIFSQSTSSIPKDILAVRAILDSNQLSKIKVGDVVEINKKMRVIALNLKKRKIHTIPDEIRTLSQLRILNLSENQLQRLPSAIGALEKITVLNLSENKLKRLPAEIGNFSQLEILDLGHNQLESLPVDIQNLRHLEDLILTDNNLRTFPNQIGGLHRLNRLFSDENNLRELPESFCFLTGLKQLSLNYNELGQLPTCVQALNAQIKVKENRLCHLSLDVEDWIYKNCEDHNWKETQRCENDVIDIEDSELPPEAFHQTNKKIPEPQTAAEKRKEQELIAKMKKREWMSASTVRRKSEEPNTLEPLKEKRAPVAGQKGNMKNTDNSYNNLTQKVIGSTNSTNTEQYSDPNRTTDAPTRRSSKKVENGVFEGLFIDRKLDSNTKTINVSFIFSSEAFLGTTLYDYYDSTHKAIVLDFYNNTLGNSQINEFRDYPITGTEVSELKLDLNKDVKGLKPDIRSVVRVKFFTDLIFPYEIEMDEFNTLLMRYQWNDELKKQYTTKSTFAKWMLPLSMVFTGALAGGFFLIF